MVDFPSGPHVMLDLETLSTANDGLVLAIGACKFDPMGTGVDDAFYVVVDPIDAQAHGLKIDASTVMWWLEQDALARDALTLADKVSLGTALEGFAMWFGSDSLPVWGNGASFDNVLLRSSYKAAGIEAPWKFWDDRCYRTLKNLAPEVKIERVGTHHNALDDAISQAAHMQAILRHMAGVLS